MEEVKVTGEEYYEGTRDRHNPWSQLLEKAPAPAGGSVDEGRTMVAVKDGRMKDINNYSK